MTSPITSRRVLLATSTVSISMLLLVTGCGGNVGGGSGNADDYPTKAITITVGAAPGGSTDLIARAVADAAADDLGVALPVVNVAGANGALAFNEVIGKPADGYELMTLNASLFTITPLAVSEDEAVSLDDADVLVGLSQDDYVTVASRESGLTSIDEIRDYEGSLSVGTAGVGTGSQLAQALLLRQADIEAAEVPFDSGAPAVTAVLGNQVQVATVQLGEAKAQIDAGELTPIVVYSEERNQFLPDVPTAAEEGYDIPVSQYRAIAGPAGLPEHVRERLVEAFQNTFANETYQQFNEQNLLTPHEISGEEVVQEWTELADRYRELIDEYDIDLGGE